jgi:hypothetical protein
MDQGPVRPLFARERGPLVVAFEETRIERTSERVLKPFNLVNVTATLRGSDREARNRVFIISGHYDSRALDVNDATTPRPAPTTMPAGRHWSWSWRAS